MCDLPHIRVRAILRSFLLCPWLSVRLGCGADVRATKKDSTGGTMDITGRLQLEMQMREARRTEIETQVDRLRKGIRRHRSTRGAAIGNRATRFLGRCRFEVRRSAYRQGILAS